MLSTLCVDKKRKKDENTLQGPSIDKCKSITKELMENPILTLVNQESCEDSVSQNLHGDEIIIIDDSSGNPKSFYKL